MSLANTASEPAGASQAEKAVTAPELKQLQSNIKELKEKITLAQKQENEGTARQFGVSAQELQKQTALLREIEATYQRQVTALRRQASLKREKEILDKELSSQQDMLVAQPPPYNLSTYDRLLDQLATLDKEEQAANEALKSSKTTLEKAKNRFEESGHQVREAEEDAPARNSTAEGLLLNWNLEHDRMGKKLAQASLELERTNAANAEAEVSLVQLRKHIIQRHANWVCSRLAYDQADLNQNLKMLEEHWVTLVGRINTLRKKQNDIENAWVAAQQQLEATKTTADETLKERALAYLKAREAWRETYQKVLEQSENTLLYLNHGEQVWQRRYALLGGKVTSEQLHDWRQETASQIESIGRLIDVQEKYQQKLQAEIAALQERLSEDGLDGKVKEHLETHVAAMNKMVERNVEYQTLLQRALAVEQRLRDAIDFKLKSGALKQKLGDLRARLESLWDFELWVVDERSVTIKKVTTAFLILVLGMLAARWFTRSVLRRALGWIRFDEGATAALSCLRNGPSRSTT